MQLGRMQKSEYLQVMANVILVVSRYVVFAYFQTFVCNSWDAPYKPDLFLLVNILMTFDCGVAGKNAKQEEIVLICSW